MFQSDGGREFDNTPMGEKFRKHCIYFIKSCPDTQQQNGVAERKHRHILEMTRSFLIEASMPSQYWLDAAYAAVFTINRLPTPLLQNKSPYEI